MRTTYVNAMVVTMDPAKPRAEAFVVDDERFVHVGSNVEARRQGGRDARVVDLGGRMVLPGFIDSHAHTTLRAALSSATPSLAGKSSIEDVLAVIRRTVTGTPPGEMILTSPIGEPPEYFGVPDSLSPPRWPSLEELDQAAPENPVIIPTPLSRPNPALLNSAALKALGLDSARKEADGVWCEVDESGAATGVVHGLNFYNAKSRFMRDLLPLQFWPRGVSMVDAIEVAIDQNLEAGVTSIYECHLNIHLDELKTLDQQARLRNRVVYTHEVSSSVPSSQIKSLLSALADDDDTNATTGMLTGIGATISLDGAIQFGKAQMAEPYLNPYGELANGSISISLEGLVDVVSHAAQQGIVLNVLAAGSGAIETAMEALRQVHRATPLNDRGWAVLHFQHPSQEQVTELATMGVYIQTYSSVDYSKGAAAYKDQLGGDAWETVVPLRWWFDAGVPVAQGTDGAHHQPLFQIWATLTRRDGATGESLLSPPKTVTREEAIASYTINGAKVMHCAEKVGSIEAGKFADFVVLDRDILECEVEEIPRTTVIATVLNGEVLAGEMPL